MKKRETSTLNIFLPFSLLLKYKEQNILISRYLSPVRPSAEQDVAETDWIGGRMAGRLLHTELLAAAKDNDST